MSEIDSKTSSATDWARVSALSDSEIDTSDIPPLDDAFFTRARLRVPAAQPLVEVTLHVEPQVLKWFQDQGSDFENRINAALRLYAEAHLRYVQAQRKSA